MKLRTDTFKVLTVDGDGVRETPVPQVMRNTLFATLWGPEKATLLRVQAPEGSDSLEIERSRMQLANQLQKLPDGFRVLGSGNGLKQGKVWAADKGVVQWCRDRYFATSEEALSYGSLLFSENRAILECKDAGIYEREGPDGQGLVDGDWLAENGLPYRQIQIRAVWPGTLAKGTLRPCWGLRAHTGKTMLFHPTMLKGRTIDIEGGFLLGIRDVAEQREFRSGWTLVQWLSDGVRQRVWDRYAVDVLRSLEDAFSSCEGALRLLALLPGNGEEEARDLTHLLLHAGLEPSHPWLRSRLKTHVRQAYIDTALGLGLPLDGGMACFVGALQENKVAVPWLPVGAELVVGRYPIRDAWSLQVVKNSCAPVPEGSIGLSANLAKQLDGDEDGDFVFVVKDPDVVESIKQLHRTAPGRLEREKKSRKRTPLSGLERVAVENVGKTGIGTPTWLIAGALASGKPDLVPQLSDQVQSAVESMKWSTSVDWELLQEIEDKVELPEYLDLTQKRKTFLEEAPRIEFGGGLEKFWNRCAEHWERFVQDGQKKLADFRDLIPVPDGELVAEAEVVRDYYHGAILGSNGNEDDINNAVKLLRAWGEGKIEHRWEWARTCWHLGHRSSHPKATGSFGLHAFPEELAELLGLERDKIVQALPPALPGLKVEVSDGGALMINEKRVEFESRRLAYGRPKESVNTTLVPIVGGWRSIMEKEHVPEKEALGLMRRVADQWRGKTVSIILKLEEVAWATGAVVNAYVGERLLGCVAPEHAERIYEKAKEPVDAIVTFRGRTAYALLLA